MFAIGISCFLVAAVMFLLEVGGYALLALLFIIVLIAAIPRR